MGCRYSEIGRDLQFYCVRLVEIGEMLSAMLQKVYSRIARDKWEYNFWKYMQEEAHRVVRFETHDFVPREIVLRFVSL